MSADPADERGSGEADPGDRFRDPSVLPLANQIALETPGAAQWPRYLIGAGMVSYGAMVVVGIVSGSFEVVEAVPLIPLLAYATFWIGRRLAESDEDPFVLQLVLAAFWSKMLGTLVRAAVVAWYYNNKADSLDYHGWGKHFAPRFRVLDFSGIPSFRGSDFMRFGAGVIYAFTGASKVSGAIVVSFLSFLGLLMLWRAFKRAVPSGDSYRYALLVLFLPSLLYWPSALGKEGWAIFCLGVASYGVARVVTGRFGSGAFLFVLGLLLVSYMRPHVALIAFWGVLLAAIVGRSRKPGGVAHILRIVLLGGLLVLGLILMSSTADFFGVPSLGQETNSQILNEAEGRTSEAGSTFSAVTVGSNPAKFPLAAVTVLFRPFPFEAGNVVAATSALEGLFLLWLCFHERARLRSIPRMMRRHPYVAYSLGIILTFIYAFSAFRNFGILSRQRCQVLPFFLVLFCLPKWGREGVITNEEAVAGRDETIRPPALQSVADPYAGLPTSPDPYAERVAPGDPYGHHADGRGHP